jgi:uncharacterized protein YndB with AHSA1/START domain
MSTEGNGQEEEEIIEIRKSIVIEASPDVVFKAITDPNELTNWFPDNAIFDGRIGGKVRFTFNKERSKELDRDYSPEGTIKEFILNKKVSYTWQLKDTPEFPETTVTWELEEIDANKTRVELVHSGFTGKEEGKLSFKEHDQGWSYFLDRLEKYCGKLK